MLEIINEDYIITAKAKGLNERQVLWKHAVGNAMIPIITSRQREMGYQRALEEHGIALNNDYILYTKHLGFEHGQQAMKKILAMHERPTAIFAVSDLLAIGALKEINASGLHVPNDIH